MFLQTSTLTLMAFTLDPHPSQQRAGLHYAVWWLQQEVTRPKGRFKPTLPEKSGVYVSIKDVQKLIDSLPLLVQSWSNTNERIKAFIVLGNDLICKWSKICNELKAYVGSVIKQWCCCVNIFVCLFMMIVYVDQLKA